MYMFMTSISYSDDLNFKIILKVLFLHYIMLYENSLDPPYPAV